MVKGFADSFSISISDITVVRKTSEYIDVALSVMPLETIFRGMAYQLEAGAQQLVRCRAFQPVPETVSQEII